LIGAFDPVGIGELWTGIVLGAIALPVAVIGYFALHEFIDVRRMRRLEPAELDEGGPVDRGTVLCDAVDQDTLRSTATQLGIPVTPERVEEDTHRSSGFVGQLFRIGAERRKEKGKKEIREPVDDPNLLVRRVLRRLDTEGKLNRHLDAVPGYGVVEDSALLGSIEENALAIDGWLSEQFPEGLDVSQRDLARGIAGALTTLLPQRQIAQIKREEFRHATDPAFVLIENEWRVRTEQEKVELHLTKLRASDYGDGRLVDIPSGLHVVARLTGELTSRGQRRLLARGEPVRAGVFGELVGYRDDTQTLEITPMAVFARI
jgi:hypothetical protein